MAFTLIATTSAHNAASGTTLDADAALNIAAGDLIVTVWLAHSGTCALASVQDTLGNNAHALGTQTIINDANVQITYRLVGEADAAAIIRVTTAAAEVNRGMAVFQFRPDSGETVTVDAGPSGGTSGWGGAADSGNITTTGTDEVVIGGVANAQGRTYAAQNIGGAGADGVVTPVGDLMAMYTIYAGTQTDIAATATLSSSGTWAAQILSFKSVAAGGAGKPAIYYQQMAHAAGM